MLKGDVHMKKNYKIDFDSAKFANKKEEAAPKNCKKVEDDCEIYL